MPVLSVNAVAPSVEGVAVPVIVSIAVSKSPTVALVRSSVAPVAAITLPPELAKAMVLPSIVRLSAVVTADVDAR